MSSARKKGTSARGGGASARAGKGTKTSKAGKTKAGPAARTNTSTGASSGMAGSSHGHGEYNQLGLLEVVQTRFLKDVFDTARCKLVLLHAVCMFVSYQCN